MNPILLGKRYKTRILRPVEYEMLEKGIKRQEKDLMTNLRATLLLGARYAECQRIQKHPEWFDGDFIFLPEEKKVKRKAPQRFIRLSTLGKFIMPYFFKSKPLPSRQAWIKNLKNWAINVGLNPVGLTTKTLRKTWESWLVFYYPKQIHAIFLSQGHTELTALKHYINLPFKEEDKKQMKKYVEGWI